MRGQAMCQTIHPDVDRGKAQRLAVILPRQERTITDRLRLMLQHGRQRPLRTIEMRLKMRKGQYLLSCIVHRYPLSRSEEHTSELQSLMRNSYAVFCLKQKNKI